jgi:peptidylprolyl isomerase
MAGEEGVDRSKLKQYLVPAVGVAAIVLLVGLVAVVSTADARKMSDGSNGSADDPDLKEVAGGVKYRDLKEGTGEPCPPGAEVTINYTGWLADGTVFDTGKHTFQLENLIQGWQEGIPGMKKGGVRKLVISPEKGYGTTPRPKIPGGSTLIFEVELTDFTVPSTAGRPMPFDQSNGGLDDPGLRDIGEGLKVRDLKEGAGEPVKPGATVTIHYTGWLPEGKVFDSSRKHGDKPVTFELGGLIEGWQRGIPGMKPGGVRKLVVPPALGYGRKGSPPDIPPNATLIFEVELVK